MADAGLMLWQASRAGHAPGWAGLVDWCRRHAAWLGEVQAMRPGTSVLPGEPVWQARTRGELSARAVAEVNDLLGGELGCRGRGASEPVQVYRQLDEAGRLRRDLVRPAEADPQPGMVLLCPVWEGGRWVGGRWDAEAAERLRRQQEAALPAGGISAVELVWEATEPA